MPNLRLQCIEYVNVIQMKVRTLYNDIKMIAKKHAKLLK